MLKKRENLWVALVPTLFSLLYVLRPVAMTLLDNGRSFSFFALTVLFFLFFPTLVHVVVSMKTRGRPYALFPAVCLIGGEIFFFHDYETWIASDPNAALALLFIPIYLLVLLGVSYLLSFFIWIGWRREG